MIPVSSIIYSHYQEEKDVRRIALYFMLVAVLCNYGCVNIPGGQAAETAVAIEAVHGASVCTGASTSPDAVWIESQQMLEVHWQRMHSHRIGGGGTPSPPSIEWETHGLVLIHMGQKRSGGYGLELMKPQASLKGGSAYIEVKWKEPPPNAIVTMMITSPCLLVKIQRGEYKTVVIVDHSGRRRLQVDL